jgi:hypothetical protein
MTAFAANFTFGKGLQPLVEINWSRLANVSTRGFIPLQAVRQLSSTSTVQQGRFTLDSRGVTK